MTGVILLIIAALWALYLIPMWLRGRSGGGGYSMPRPAARAGGGRGSVVLFPSSSAPSRGVSGGGLSGIAMVRPGVPRTAHEARRRRRDVLLGLAATAVVTLLLAFAVGGIFWVIHLLVDMALVGFGYLVHEHETRARERAEKVTALPVRRPAGRPADVELRRRAAN